MVVTNPDIVVEKGRRINKTRKTSLTLVLKED